MTEQTQLPYKEALLDEVRKLMDDGYEVVDVREGWEWERGHLPGARHIVLNRLLGNPGAHQFRDRTIFVCEVGNRSAIAAEMAIALGAKDVVNFRGGTEAWRTAGLPLEKP
jgi:hydroxyacylglutathione hydrolase